MIRAGSMKIAVGILVTFLVWPGIASPAAVPGDEEIVAKVNGIAITKGDVRQRVDIYERAHPGLAPGESRIRRAGIAVQVLIYAVLTEQLARELGVTVTKDDIEAEYAKIRGRQSEATFVSQLRFQGNDPAALRRDISRGLYDEKIKATLMEKMVVTERDIQAKYEEEKRTMFPEQVKARQIIVLTEDVAKELHQQLKQGADFAQLAQSTSTENYSRDLGGDLGWVLRGTGHYPPWDDTVFKTKPGNITEPFQTVHGWHIVKVEGYRPWGWGKAEDKRDHLVMLVKQQRAMKEMERRLEELKKKADIWQKPRIELEPPASTMTVPQK
jgi:parvulin-like peptidyl-prolyl isomerase